MTLTEFKAWFEGYSENIGKQPTQKQWSRIKEKVEAIDGVQITREVIHRWWPSYPRWEYATYTSGLSPSGLSGGSVGEYLSTNAVSNNSLGKNGREDMDNLALLFHAGARDAEADA